MELHRGESAYEKTLAGVFNGDASASHPACIAQPGDEQEVAFFVRQARDQNRPLRVRSGGHSRFCSGDGALMLDLAAHWRAVSVSGDLVRVQGGCGVGAVLQALAPHGRMLPVGTHATPGFGLLTMGGLGHLSRSFGLTLDCVEALRGVRADGERFEIRADQADGSEAWRLLRGAAPFLAVITEATLRTCPRRPLQVIRQLRGLPSLAESLQCAESLPRQIACSFVLGVPPDATQAQLMRYVVLQVGDEPLLPASLREGPACWQDQVAGQELLPDFNLPDRHGLLPPEPPVDPDRFRRLRSWIYTVSVRPGHAADLARWLGEAITKAPNRLCRIDLQHSGGAVSDRPLASSLYRGREAEWSIVISGFWPAGDTRAEQSACRWADAVFDVLAPIACHVYLVERHPDTIRYQRELDLAFGPDLPRLREMKRQWDPDGLLPSLDASVLRS